MLDACCDIPVLLLSPHSQLPAAAGTVQHVRLLLWCVLALLPRSNILSSPFPPSSSSCCLSCNGHSSSSNNINRNRNSKSCSNCNKGNAYS